MHIMNMNLQNSKTASIFSTETSCIYLNGRGLRVALPPTPVVRWSLKKH